jgi:DNA-binding MarR family transcriptional regulator
MIDPSSSSPFTPKNQPASFGPPMIGALLRTPWEDVQRHMLRRLHEKGCADFDAAYLPIFGYPGPQGARPSELAARLGMSKQALNYLLGCLERAGYLERQPHPDDARSRRIALTPRGLGAVKVIRDGVAELETSWTQLLGPMRFAQLREMLQELGQSTVPPT